MVQVLKPKKFIFFNVSALFSLNMDFLNRKMIIPYARKNIELMMELLQGVNHLESELS